MESWVYLRTVNKSLGEPTDWKWNSRVIYGPKMELWVYLWTVNVTTGICIYGQEMELWVYVQMGNGSPGVSTDRKWNFWCIYM
jgi:hypothetical protein